MSHPHFEKAVVHPAKLHRLCFVSLFGMNVLRHFATSHKDCELSSSIEPVAEEYIQNERCSSRIMDHFLSRSFMARPRFEENFAKIAPLSVSADCRIRKAFSINLSSALSSKEQS